MAASEIIFTSVTLAHTALIESNRLSSLSRLSKVILGKIRNHKLAEVEGRQREIWDIK